MALKLLPLDARIPKWDLENLIERSCPICNYPDAYLAYERPDGLNVKFCEKCHTYFVSPSPSNEQLQTFYEDYDEKHRRAPRISKKKLSASYEGVDPLTDIRIRELISLMKFTASRVLDVGFGRAYFLYCLKKLGAIPFGLELDAQAIEFAKFLGIDSFKGEIIDFVSEPKYDLITLLDLVEHPLNPMDTLRKSSELLKSGGLLLIWTPNGDFESLEENPTTFRVDLEHMQYFTADTCVFIASELKMRVVHLETLGFPALEGIDKLFSKNEEHVNFMKKIIKSIPGFSTVNTFRHSLFKQDEKIYQDERMGSYHLFCIMQKPV